MIAWWMGLDLSQQIFALVGIAASVILLFCVGVLTFVYFRLLSRKVHYQ